MTALNSYKKKPKCLYMTEISNFEYNILDHFYVWNADLLVFIIMPEIL